MSTRPSGHNKELIKLALKKTPFRTTKLEEEKKDDKRETFTVSINKEERARLNEDKKILQQEKDSTALKQLAELGRNVLHSDLTGKSLKIVLGNKRRNKRLGIVDFE